VRNTGLRPRSAGSGSETVSTEERGQVGAWLTSDCSMALSYQQITGEIRQVIRAIGKGDRLADGFPHDGGRMTGVGSGERLRLLILPVVEGTMWAVLTCSTRQYIAGLPRRCTSVSTSAIWAIWSSSLEQPGDHVIIATFPHARRCQESRCLDRPRSLTCDLVRLTCQLVCTYRMSPFRTLK
jgi:hypothetical protein